VRRLPCGHAADLHQLAVCDRVEGFQALFRAPERHSSLACRHQGGGKLCGVFASEPGAPDVLDRGTLALSLSYAAPGSFERLARARVAHDAFSDALKRLDDEAWVRVSAPWRVWHADVYTEARRTEPNVELSFYT
jgi:hypothetical protein